MAGRRGVEIYNTPQWRAARAECLARANRRCAVCGLAGADEVHHVRALAAGGAPFDQANLQAVHFVCHLRLHGRAPRPDMRAWRALLAELE